MCWQLLSAQSACTFNSFRTSITPTVDSNIPANETGTLRKRRGRSERRPLGGRVATISTPFHLEYLFLFFVFFSHGDVRVRPCLCVGSVLGGNVWWPIWCVKKRHRGAQ